MTVETEIQSIEEYQKRTDRGEKLTLQQAAEKANVSKARMRSIVNASDSPIRSWKETLPGVGIKVAYLFEQDLADYLGNRTPRAKKSGDGTTSTRTPGAKAYVIKLTEEQHAALVSQFAEMGIELADRYNYNPEKSKAYREERKAKQLAELGAEQAAQKKQRKAKQQEQLALPENQTPIEPDSELTTRLDGLLSED